MGGFNPMLIGPLFRLLFSKTGLILVGIFLVFSFLTGNNPLSLIGNFFTGGGSPTETSAPYEGTPKENELAEYHQYRSYIVGSECTGFIKDLQSFIKRKHYCRFIRRWIDKID